MTEIEKRFALRRFEAALKDAAQFAEGVKAGVLITQDLGPMQLSADDSYRSSQITVTITDAVPAGSMYWEARVHHA